MAAKKSYGSKSGVEKDSFVLLKDQIKNRNLAPVYLFTGEERFLVDYYIGEIKRLILENDPAGMNLILFEGKTDAGDLEDACDTFPIFAERKMVLVRNSAFFTLKGKDSKKEDTQSEASQEGSEEEHTPAGSKGQERLKNYLAQIPSSTCLVFDENQVDKRSGLYKQTVKYGLAVEFGRQKPDELVRWVMRGFKQQGKNINPEAARFMVDSGEEDMYFLRGEILKISAYTGDRQDVGLEDIRLVGTTTIKSVIFSLLDALSEKNGGRAIKLLDDLLEIKEPEQKILFMIAKQTGEQLKLKKLLASRVRPEECLRYFPGKHPYAMKLLIQQAERANPDVLSRLLKNCMEADTAVKTGKMSARLALELLISRV